MPASASMPSLALPPSCTSSSPPSGLCGVPRLTTPASDLNAANEEAVAAFTAGRLSFPGIVQLVARTLDDAPDLGAPTCVEDVLAAEKWAREHARGVIAGG